MYGFTSYYWDITELKPRQRRAVTVLNQSGDRTEVVGAMMKLLHSRRYAAHGVAMDQYHHTEAMTRFGMDNPLAEFAAELRSRAVAMLDVALDTQSRGANQPRGMFCSPLLVLEHLAEAADLDLADRMLDAVTPRLTDELPADLFPGIVNLVHICLLRRAADAQRTVEIGTRLAAIAADERLPGSVREKALAPFVAHHDGGTALGQTEVLLQLLHDSDRAVATSAAASLIFRGHHGVVRDAVSQWPTDADAATGTGWWLHKSLADAERLTVLRDTLNRPDETAMPSGEPADHDLADRIRELARLGSHTDIDLLLRLAHDHRGESDVIEAVCEGLARLIDDDQPGQDWAGVDGLDAARQRAGKLCVELIGDEGLSHRTRAAAFTPLRNATALGQHEAMLALLRGPDRWLAAEAAQVLLEGEHREPVRTEAAEWPDDMPRPADYVRVVLELHT